MYAVEKRHDDARLGQADSKDRCTKFESNDRFLFRIVPDDQLSMPRSALSWRRPCRRRSAAYLVLRKLGLSPSSDDGQVIRLAEHFDDANTSVEVCDVKIQIAQMISIRVPAEKCAAGDENRDVAYLWILSVHKGLR